MGLRWLPSPLFPLLPGGLLQPTFEAIPSPITHLTQLIPPALGSLQQILANAGSRQRQILKADQSSRHNTGLLINDCLLYTSDAADE